MILLNDSKYKSILIGLILGELCVFIYHFFILPQVPQSRLSYAIGASNIYFINNFFNNPIACIYLSFGPFWIVICYLGFVSKRLILFIIFNLIIAVCVQDYTRVFLLLSMPSLIYLVDNFIGKIKNKEISLSKNLFRVFFIFQFFQIELPFSDSMIFHIFSRLCNKFL